MIVSRLIGRSQRETISPWCLGVALMSELTTIEQRKARIQALERLIQINEILIQRFGEGATLGEMKSGTIAHMAFLHGESLTIAELAKLSGQARESISRWIERSSYVQLTDHPHDARSKLMAPVDLDVMMAYLDLISEIDGP